MKMEENMEIEEIQLDKRIISFFEQNKNMTIATSLNNIPYCAHCFFAFDKDECYLIFKSNPDTKHIRQAIENPRVAGTVAPDKLEKAKIMGIQFGGNFIVPENEILERAEKIYYSKFPFAKLFSGEFWLIEVTEIKMTDNTLGFGKKIEWVRKNKAQINS
jgi:uncharacterized protein